MKVDVRHKKKKKRTTTDSSFIQICINDDVLKALVTVRQLKIEKQSTEISVLEINWKGQIFWDPQSSQRTCEPVFTIYLLYSVLLKNRGLKSVVLNTMFKKCHRNSSS